MGNRTSTVAKKQGERIVSQQLKEQIERQAIEEIKAEHITRATGNKMAQFTITTQSRASLKERVNFLSLKRDNNLSLCFSVGLSHLLPY
jgi:hypothetical protein